MWNPVRGSREDDLENVIKLTAKHEPKLTVPLS